MKSNNTHNIRQGKDNSCAVISAIFAYKAREAVISVLTERAPLRHSLNRADAEKGVCELISRRRGSTNDQRLTTLCPRSYVCH